MRKDAKLGFAIGGILLAVLAVYFLIDPTDSPSGTELVLEEALDPTAGVSSDSNATERTSDRSESSPDRSSAAGASLADATNATSEDAAAPARSGAGDADWDGLLMTGRSRVTPLMSATPEPAHLRSSPLRQEQQAAAGAVARAVLGDQDDEKEVERAATRIQPVPPEQYSVARPALDAPAERAGQIENTGGARPTAVAVSPNDAPSPTVPATYTIREGDTLTAISTRIYGSANYWPHLQRANPGLDANRLRPGDIIRVLDRSQVVQAQPAAAAQADVDPAREYRVQSGDSLYKISLRLYGKADRTDRIYELNRESIGPDRSKLRLNMVLKLPEPPTQTASR